MDAIIRFLQDTGFYLFSQDGNWRCLIMLGIACVLLYLGIVKKFEPLLLVPIAFGMLITNLPGANMFHEIFFAGGHIHWDLIGGQPVTASLLADLHSQGVAENVLAPYIQQLMTAAQTTFSPEMVEQAIAAVTEEAGAAISALEAQLQALVQAEQAAAYYGMTLSDITITPGLVDILYLGVKLGIYPCLIFMGVGAMTDFGPRDPAPHHEAADHGEGAPDCHEAPPGGQQEGEDHLPHRSDHLRGAAGALCRPPHCLPHAGQPL